MAPAVSACAGRLPSSRLEARRPIARLIYLTLASLDGYVADDDGKFDWAEPDAEVHAFVNDLARPVGTYLYGRSMYEVMIAWETLDIVDADNPNGALGLYQSLGFEVHHQATTYRRSLRD